MSETKTIFAGAAGVGAILGGFIWLTSESDTDIARKPDLIEQITQNSLTHCTDQSAPTDDQPTIERLKAVLEGTRSSSMGFLIKNNVTVCLDKRIANENFGFWDRKPQAIYYPDSKIVSLWDDGTKNTFWNKGAAQYGGHMLNELTTSIGDGFFDDFNTIEDIQVPYIGYTYITNVTATTIARRYDFKTIESKTFSDLLPNHPTLQEPPFN